MCVFFIFFTPTIPPLHSVKPPQKKSDIEKSHVHFITYK